jgi:hypothetical protein
MGSQGNLRRRRHNSGGAGKCKLEVLAAGSRRRLQFRSVPLCFLPYFCRPNGPVILSASDEERARIPAQPERTLTEI